MTVCKNILAAGKSNQSIGEDVNSERVVGCHVDIDPQVKLVTTDEVGLVQVPAKHNQQKDVLP